MTPNVASDRVLSTLNRDGTRNVLHPKLARGRFLRGRRVVGFALIALFVLLPRIRIGGRPAVLIDLTTREISLFGTVFRPTDGFLLALFGIAIVATVFFVTALYGRVWCGWGCPQSVYLEHVFRPIERWLEGSRGQRVTWWRRGVKLGIFAGLAFALANVFLAYFVGTDRLEQWVFESPSQHLGGFTVVMAVTALVFFDFAYFREQACILACPYGRLQSVLLDRQSLIVGYDPRRGEPRGKAAKRRDSAPTGDCIDCGACVKVCPTGIDIRNGLQMECIGCAQCIDACDGVMDKIHRPRGLIRYTSQDDLAGKPRRLIRMRTIVYPVLLITAVAALTWKLSHRSSTEVTVQRLSGPSFFELDGRSAAQLDNPGSVPLQDVPRVTGVRPSSGISKGHSTPEQGVRSRIDIKIENVSDDPHAYRLTLVTPAVGQLRSPVASWKIPPRESRVVPLFVDLPRSAFVHGRVRAQIRVANDADFDQLVQATLFGPEVAARE